MDNAATEPTGSGSANLAPTYDLFIVHTPQVPTL
jgi:hypothetical protein